MEEEEMSILPSMATAASAGIATRVSGRFSYIRWYWKEILWRILIKIVATAIFIYATYGLLSIYPEITYPSFFVWLTVLALWALALRA